MRTAIISDIHIDINKEYDVINAVAEYIRENEAELLLVAGDISDSVDITLEAVRNLEKKSGARVLYVPGNHDMWNKENKYSDNEEIYQKYVKDEHCLSGKVFDTGKYCIVGEIGWYDYSFGNHELYKLEDFEKKSINGRTVQDSIFNTTWSRNNKETSERFVKELEQKLKEQQGKELVLMTHMLSHEAFLVPESRENWSYLNGFLGSKDLKRLCEEQQVKYAICGHVHYRRNVTEGNTTWLCRCLNYHTEWRGERDVRKQVESAMDILEL